MKGGVSREKKTKIEVQWGLFFLFLLLSSACVRALLVFLPYTSPFVLQFMTDIVLIAEMRRKETLLDSWCFAPGIPRLPVP